MKHPRVTDRRRRLMVLRNEAAPSEAGSNQLAAVEVAAAEPVVNPQAGRPRGNEPAATVIRSNAGLAPAAAEEFGEDGPLRLEISHAGGDRKCSVLIEQPFAVLGRSPECDLRLIHTDVGLRHAYLQQLDHRIVWIDLSGRPDDSGPPQPAAGDWLDAGDSLHLGPFLLRLPDEPVPAGLEQEFARMQRESQADFQPSFPNVGLRLKRPASSTSNRACWPIRRRITLLGSGRNCHLQLRHKSVSEVHCSLVLTERGLWVVDLLSELGTAVDGRPVRFARLNQDSSLQIGGIVFRVQYATTPGALWVSIPSSGLLRDVGQSPTAAATPGSYALPRNGSAAPAGLMPPGQPAPGAISDPGVPDPGVLDPGVPDPGVSDPGVSDPGVSHPSVPHPSVFQAGVSQAGVFQASVPQAAVSPPPAQLPRPDAGGGGFSESFVLTLINQLSSMQMQMQMQMQTMNGMIQMFQAMQQDYLSFIREDLHRVQELTLKLQDLQWRLLQHQVRQQQTGQDVQILPALASVHEGRSLEHRPAQDVLNPNNVQHPRNVQDVQNMQHVQHDIENTPDVQDIQDAAGPSPSTNGRHAHTADRYGDSSPPPEPPANESEPERNAVSANAAGVEPAAGAMNGSRPQGGPSTGFAPPSSEQQSAQPSEQPQPPGPSGNGTHEPLESYEWLFERIREVTEERDTLWQKITRTLTGRGTGPRAEP